MSLSILYIISETHQKNVSCLSRKFEKLSKTRLIWGCCNGKTHISHRVILLMKTQQIIWNLFYKKICLSHSCAVRNWSFSENNAEKMIILLWPTPTRPPIWLSDLSQWYIFVKRPQLSNNGTLPNYFQWFIFLNSLGTWNIQT